MRKVLSVLAAAALLGSFALAGESKAEAAKAKASVSASEPSGGTAAKKAPGARQLTGVVEAVDAAEGTVTVKGKRKAVRFRAGGKAKLDRIAVGDRVRVRYSGDTASSVRKVPARTIAGKRPAAGPPPPAPAAAAQALPATPAGRK